MSLVSFAYEYPKLVLTYVLILHSLKSLFPKTLKIYISSLELCSPHYDLFQIFQNGGDKRMKMARFKRKRERNNFKFDFD